MRAGPRPDNREAGYSSSAASADVVERGSYLVNTIPACAATATRPNRLTGVRSRARRCRQASNTALGWNALRLVHGEYQSTRRVEPGEFVTQGVRHRDHLAGFVVKENDAGFATRHFALG